MLSLLFLPFTGTAKGFLFLSDHIARESERAFYDEDAIRGSLLALETRLEAGEISEEEYALGETHLMERLAEAVSRRESRSLSEGG